MNAERLRLSLFTLAKRPKAGLLASCGLMVCGAVAGAAEADPLPREMVAPAEPGAPVISWWNGEQLAGELAGADASHLLWKSDLFAAPVRLGREVIRRVEFPGGFAVTESGEPFRLVLEDGSHLTGEIESIDGETVVFRSARCGSLRVRSEAVVLLERIRGAGLVAGGAAALLSAESTARGRFEKSRPYLAAGGQSVCLAFNGGAYQALELGHRVFVEVDVRFPEDPALVLHVAAEGDRTSIETWGDELVLVGSEERFASAGEGSAVAGQRLRLRLGWDRLAGRSVLFGADGTVLAELPPLEPSAVPASAPAPVKGPAEPRIKGRIAPEEGPGSGPGITLVNRGGGLLIERYQVADWNGENPPPLLGEEPGAETVTGAVTGEIVGLREGSIIVRGPDGSERGAPLEEVRALRWRRGFRAGRDATQAELWFADGGLLRGGLTSVAEGQARLETAFASEPVEVSLQGLRLLLPPGERPGPEVIQALDGLDVLQVGKTTLHGAIRPVGAELPQFQPVGSAESLLPASSPDLILTRALPEEGAFTRAPSLLHVRGDETWPVTLVGIGPETVQFAWEGVEAREIPTASLHAVQWEAPFSGKQGFESPGWQVLGSGGATRSGEGVVLPPESGIGHPYLIQGSDFSFRLQPVSGMTSLRVRLFCLGTARESDSMDFLIAYFGEQLYCGLEGDQPGQMQSQTTVPAAEGSALVSFGFAGSTVEMRVNGVSVVRSEVEGQKGRKAGAGLILETTSVWGNRIGPAKLWDFSMRFAPAIAIAPPFSDDARREALLLPRLRRDVPPRQVLIGRNGDLLRGEIEGLAGAQLLFRIGLNHVKIPLDRVSAAVWVAEPDKAVEDNVPRKPAPEPEPAPEVSDGPALRLEAGAVAGAVLELAAPEPAEGEVGEVEEDAAPPDGRQWLDLTNGGRLGLTVETWSEEEVTGRHPVLGRCVVPFALVHRLALRPPRAAGALAALAGWKFENTPDPVPPGSEEANASPLLGQAAQDFTLPMLEGDPFVLSKAKGKVVVLDFWATWCAPCVRSLPPLAEAMGAFPPEQVIFLAVNQGETREQVERFLETRGLRFPVAFDADMAVGRQFQVEGIPHTMVIDAAGNVAYVSTGAVPNGEEKVTEAVRKALGTVPAEPVVD